MQQNWIKGMRDKIYGHKKYTVKRFEARWYIARKNPDILPSTSSS